MAEDFFGVGPVCEGAFCGDAFDVVEDVVKDSESRVAYSDFVKVGKAQCNGEAAFSQVFFYLVDFAADVSAWFSDKRQELGVNPVGENCYMFFTHWNIIQLIIDNR